VQFLVEHDWAIFIGLEVCALIFILAFMGTRYLLSRRPLSNVLLGLFLLMMVLEGVLAFVVYQVTGEVSTFQVVVVLFLLYAVTFGVHDFKRLDYSARMRIGTWRRTTLVTEEETEKMRALKDPKTVARKSRIWFYVHTVIFGGALIYFWNTSGTSEHSWLYFIQNWDWFGDEDLTQPFTSELLSQVVRLWLIIYIVDSIINWSYTFFPNKVSEDKSI